MTRKQKTNPEWETMKAERRDEMTAAGFPEGARVRVTTDAHPNIPEAHRFNAGDEGIVLLNMAHGPEQVSVRFDSETTSIPHAVRPENLETV